MIFYLWGFRSTVLCVGHTHGLKASFKAPNSLSSFRAQPYTFGFFQPFHPSDVIMTLLGDTLTGIAYGLGLIGLVP